MADQESRPQAISLIVAPAAIGWSESARVNRRTTGAGRGPDVTVKDGEVTLSGTVEDRDARWLAEDLAESASGVRAVHNRLRVAHA